jgi:hypothetical protein
MRDAPVGSRLGAEACNFPEVAASAYHFHGPPVTWISDATIRPTGGLAVTDSAVVAYDRDAQKVSVLIGREWRSFGLPASARGAGGRADGSTVRLRHAGSLPNWIDVSGDTIAIVQASEVVFLTLAGDELGAFSLLEASRGEADAMMIHRIRFGTTGLLLGVELVPRRVPPEGRRLSMSLLDKAEQAVFVSLPLDDVPRDRTGTMFLGPTEARSKWDATRDCLVVSDGWSGRLWVGRSGEGIIDSLRIPLPEGPPEAEVAGSGALLRTLPRPTREQRIHDLIVGPDGWLWARLTPVGRASLAGVEILRFHLRSRQVMYDTLPVFPMAIGPDGSVYAAFRDKAGQAGIVRVERSIR